ncbi:hypothetical protein HK096_006461 [Nowakowskiella sp. JEL0078]|nr:hypothetical protein HK096_006461 [Nowakowskiella sp. JEL0078]
MPELLNLVFILYSPAKLPSATLLRRFVAMFAAAGLAFFARPGILTLLQYAAKQPRIIAGTLAVAVCA